MKGSPFAFRKDEAYESLKRSIALIDMNLCQRTDIPPSEKGAAYKLRLEAMKRQGYRTDLEEDATSAQPGQKSGVTFVEQLANESPDSKSQIKRFIRITELEPELQKIKLCNLISLSAC